MKKNNSMTSKRPVPRLHEIFQFKSGAWAMVTQHSPTIKIVPPPSISGIHFDNVIKGELEFTWDEWPEIKQIYKIPEEGK